MKKYLFILKNSLSATLAYRFNVFAKFFSEAFSLLVLAYVWFSIYQQGNEVGSYTLSALIAYYIFSRVIFMIVKPIDPAWKIGDMIREGRLSAFLCKPVDFFKYEFSSYLGSAVFYFFVYAPFIVLALILLREKIELGIGGFFYFFLSLIISICLNFTFFYVIGISGFFIENIQGFNFLMITIINFLSGYFIPIDILPEILKNIIIYLPFKHMIFVPVSILNNRLENIEANLFFGFLWLGFFYFLARIIYKKGLKKYEAFGA